MNGIPSIPEEALYAINVYPERVDFDRLELVFCRMSRGSYRESPFLDHRIIRAQNVSFAMPFGEVDSLAGLPATAITHAVFHSAFCCSTLMSRYIDALDQNLVLREPHAMYELIILELMQGTGALPEVPSDRIHSLQKLVRYLLGRRHRQYQPVVIKHTDGCNIRMMDLLSETPGNRGLFMWSSLERFLTSIMKLPQRRQWIYIRLQELLVAWAQREGGLPLDTRTLKPHQAAALLWILQMDNMERALGSLPGGTLASLSAQDFMADPTSVLQQVLSHFGTPLEREEIEKKLGAAKLDKHAKNADEDYSSAKREMEFEKARTQFAMEIDAALEWSEGLLGKNWRNYKPPAALGNSGTTV